MSETNLENFPLLKEIDEQIESNSIEWNQNAFETLITSNLEESTIVFYSLEVAFRCLENSFYEQYWDSTFNALKNLTDVLLKSEIAADLEDYFHEAKCQLLFFSSIALIKLQRIRRLPAKTTKLSVATILSLLFFQNRNLPKFSEKTNAKYSKCIESMRNRFYQRIFLSAFWLKTISTDEHEEINKKNENYLTTFLENLFYDRSVREKLEIFVEKNLFNQDENFSSNDEISQSFVLVKRFPKLNEHIFDKNADRIQRGFGLFLEKFDPKSPRFLNFCLWAVSGAMVFNRSSLIVLIRHFSKILPAEFLLEREDHPSEIDPLNNQDLLFFLILVAKQYQKEISSMPFSFYFLPRFCNKTQEDWWFSVVLKAPKSKNFLDELATIRLEQDNNKNFPPKAILLATAQFVLSAIQTDFDQLPRSSTLLYEKYATRYFEAAKNISTEQNFDKRRSKIENKIFDFAPLKIDEKENVKLVEQCEESFRHFDELKLQPEPELPLVSTPITSERNSPIFFCEDEIEDKISINHEPIIHEETESTQVIDSNIDEQEVPTSEPKELDKTQELEGSEPKELDKTQEPERSEPKELDKTQELERSKPNELNKTQELEGSEPSKLDKTQELEGSESNELNKTQELEGLEPSKLDKTQELEGSESNELNKTQELERSEELKVRAEPEGNEQLNEEQEAESPFVEMIFNHISGVNQWINGFYTSNERIQTDINAVRDRLERLNRATNQMISNNLRFFQMESDDSNQ